MKKRGPIEKSQTVYVVEGSEEIVWIISCFSESSYLTKFLQDIEGISNKVELGNKINEVFLLAINEFQLLSSNLQHEDIDGTNQFEVSPIQFISNYWRSNPLRHKVQTAKIENW